MDFIKIGLMILSEKATTRAEFIGFIELSASDEYDNLQSLWHLAKKTDKEVIEVVKSIIKY